MLISVQNTVREIVGRHPQTRRVFARHGIDYCCGGKHSLANAAKAVKADPRALLADLEAALAAPPDPQHIGEKDWYAAPLPELVGHIQAVHHAYLHAALPELRQLVAKVLQVRGPRHGAVLQAAARSVATLDLELNPHLMKEERILFPHILAVAKAVGAGQRRPFFPGGTAAVPIRQMQLEHESAGTVLADLRGATGGYVLPADACPTFAALYTELQRLEADLHQHIHLENNILFPRTLDLETGPRA